MSATLNGRHNGLFEIVPNIGPQFVRANSKCLKSNEEKTNLQQSQLAYQKFAYTNQEYDERGKKAVVRFFIRNLKSTKW